MVQNPFVGETAGRMYAAGRPDYSATVGRILRRLLDIDPPFSRALDVACGTGTSTKALAGLAPTVVGVDSSMAMLGHREPIAGDWYLASVAEALPFADNTFDLIAVGLALHWFDLPSFLSEASRVATGGAPLVVHTHWWNANMVGNPDFRAWNEASYVKTYPVPARGRSWRPPDDLGEWRHVGWERYEHAIPMTRDEVVSYLMTQSNVQVALDSGQPESHVREWLSAEIDSFFDEPRAEMSFGGYVAVHRRR